VERNPELRQRPPQTSRDEAGELFSLKYYPLAPANLGKNCQTIWLLDENVVAGEMHNK